jgi:ectoine hydroxylase-related dioxygenase (phytanoyl-CoA dioxygenase family)
MRAELAPQMRRCLVMSVTQDQKFEFDVLGFVHIKRALPSDELATYRTWVDAIKETSVEILNAGNPEAIKTQLNRPLSRVIDADPRFAHFLDHPAVVDLLVEFLGEDYRHIDNDLYFTYPGYAGGRWHRGVRAHPTGHVVGGRFICPMVKVFYCLTDVGPGEGEFVVVPGSHKASFEIDTNRVDLPAQHVFDNVAAGDIIVFNEALLHNGRPNPSTKTRQTIIMNLGRGDAGVWAGYQPTMETLDAVTPRQRAILSNQEVSWEEPELAAV